MSDSRDPDFSISLRLSLGSRRGPVIDSSFSLLDPKEKAMAGVAMRP